jgi:hypothetical protein
MARDTGLEELVNDELRTTPGITEKAMFGGLAWLLHGNMLCAARQDSLLVRLGKGRDAWALQRAGIVPMRFGERRMQGWIRADPGAFSDDALRRKLIASAIEFVKSLPEK